MNYNFNYILSDDFINTIPFSKYIIEYFKNDYRVIRDFLTNNSPWDLVIEWKLSITHDELIEKKVGMYNAINNTYFDCFLKNLSESDFEKYITTDKSIEYILKHKKLVIQLFSEDIEFATKMIRIYMEMLKTQTDLKENTYNKYKIDIENIIGIYDIEYMKNSMDDNFEEELENTSKFFSMVNYRVKKYIKTSFISKKEREEFVEYIISLAYAYLKNMLNTCDDDVLDEEIDFMSIIEKSKPSTLLNLFENNNAFFTVLLETLSSCLLEYRQSCDIRKKIDDEESIKVFNSLDKNFNTKYPNDIVVEDYTIDILLERVINTFIRELTNDQIFDLLTDEISIYYDLFSNGLDPRFEKKYKLLLIRKLIVNSYEYLLYLYDNKDDRLDLDEKIESIKLPKKDQDVIVFFCNNYNDILNMYRDYYKKDVNFFDRVRINIYKDHKCDLIKMKNTYNYIEGRYFGIMMGKVQKLESVDYINDIYRRIVVENKVVLNGTEEIEKYFKTICFYIYERIINIKDCSQNVKIEIKEMIDTIGSIKNFSTEIFKNQDLLQKINYWYISLSIKNISYYEETKLRDKIHNPEHIKVLNRLNEFNENIKN